MEIYLFEPLDVWSRFVCWKTNRKYSHAAIGYNGMLFDICVKRGNFAHGDQSMLLTHKWIMYDLGEQPVYNFLASNMWKQKKYSRGPLCELRNNYNLPAFQVIWECLQDIGIAWDLPELILETDIIELIEKRGFKRETNV